MWVFGGLILVGVLVLIGLVAWAIRASRHHAAASGRAGPPREPLRGSKWASGDGTGRLLDERFARGEMDHQRVHRA